MLEEIMRDLDSRGADAIESLKKALQRIRTGRANVTMLDPVAVEYYGSKVPLNQVATLTVSDPRLISVKPFERSLMGEIEKAIRSNADLGLTPQNDGERILLPIPPLTEERRKEFTKIAKSKAEDAKVSVRNARRDANELIKTMEKDGALPEDDSKKAQAEVQKKTDAYVGSVDEIVAKKEKEIMEV